MVYIITATTMTNKSSTNDPWMCVLCKQRFAGHFSFKAHHILKYTSLERCLDRDELTALDWTRSNRGIWYATSDAQTRPRQAQRLATVRQEIEAAVFGPGAHAPVAFA